MIQCLPATGFEVAAGRGRLPPPTMFSSGRSAYGRTLDTRQPKPVGAPGSNFGSVRMQSDHACPVRKSRSRRFFRIRAGRRGVFCQAPGATRFLAKPSEARHKFMSSNGIGEGRVLPRKRAFGETLRPGKSLRGWTPGLGWGAATHVQVFERRRGVACVAQRSAIYSGRAVYTGASRSCAGNSTSGDRRRGS
jgi:hypothetical protein